MVFPREISILCTITCTIIYTTPSACIELYTKSYYFPSGILQEDYESLFSPGLLYSICSTDIEENSKKHCTFALETKKSVDSSDHLRFCNITVESSSKNQPILRIKNIYGFGQDKGIVTWKEATHFHRLGIIHFNECRFVNAQIDAKFDLDRFDFYAVTDNSFDVILNNHDKSQNCSGSQECKMTINSEGVVTDGPKKWLEDDIVFLAIVHSPSYNYLIVDLDYDQNWDPVVRLSTADYNGSMKNMKEYAREKDDYDKNKVSVSVTHQLITICSAANSKVKCGQFDLNGVLKFEKSIDITEFKRLHKLRVYNLENGGFLSLTSECLKTDKILCRASEKNFFVRKFDANGKNIGILEINQFNRCLHGYVSKSLHFFESETKQLCLSRVCDNRQSTTDRVNLEAVCFKNEDFS